MKHLDELGPRLASIANTAVGIVADATFPIWLYVEIGDGWVELSIFQDLPYEVRYVDDNQNQIFELSDEIVNAWERSNAEDRWSIMELSIINGKFHVDFGYVKGGIEDDLSDGRRQAWLRKRFAGKRVTYPPLPSSA